MNVSQNILVKNVGKNKNLIQNTLYKIHRIIKIDKTTYYEITPHNVNKKAFYSESYFESISEFRKRTIKNIIKI